VYYEKHHILPTSLYPEERLTAENIVLLTAREHYICHCLLLKIYPESPEMYKAWVRITGAGVLSSKLYDKMQNAISDAAMTFVVTEKTKQKISATKKGVKQSKEHTAKLALAHTGTGNGKFAGYYHTPAGRFPSSYKAAEQNGVSSGSIAKWCKQNLKDGYWFEPIL